MSQAALVSPEKPSVSRIGKFYITRELGRGSVGTVYLAQDPIIDRPVAVKTFAGRVSAREKRKFEQQFINEARAAGRLSHPNIVTIFEASSEDGPTYIAMEYLQGRELSKMLDKRHPFTPHEVATLVCKVADALEYAHKNDVIHRDIKPANIFVNANNEPKIVDFGIARAPNRVSQQAMDDEHADTLFQNNLLGTPNYMSPEQAMGRVVDSRTDVYSLGAVMYEMLAGRKPFQSSASDQLLASIAHKAPSTPLEINPNIPAALSEIVMKAMSKKPEKRFQSAGEMAGELRNYLAAQRPAHSKIQRQKSPAVVEQTSVFTSDIRQLKYFLLYCAGITAALGAVFMLWMR